MKAGASGPRQGFPGLPKGWVPRVPSCVPQQEGPAPSLGTLPQRSVNAGYNGLELGRLAGPPPLWNPNGVLRPLGPLPRSPASPSNPYRCGLKSAPQETLHRDTWESVPVEAHLMTPPPFWVIPSRHGPQLCHRLLSGQTLWRASDSPFQLGLVCWCPVGRCQLQSEDGGHPPRAHPAR